MSLYGWVILGSISGPFFLSFDKKVAFYKYWKYLFPSIFGIAILFLLWDEYFTQNKIWGFTPQYLSGIYLGHLPLEEVLFFLVVPYACFFIYEVLKSYFPNIQTARIGQILAFKITLLGLILGIVYLDNWYTSSACIAAALLTIGIYFIQKASWYGQFALTYIVVLIPFVIVNGILTGAITPEPIVWYSSEHIMGPRIYTIPVEDLFYNYAMLLPMTALYERFKK
ncbi:MAG: lycopene cyclase domain-containing protein [Cryomorphaceae bacterium]|jgi:lycopene cyclase domain-containing protein|nr:lycopene cyclase domain-containing protein [Cryomorphaceae bacterium]